MVQLRVRRHLPVHRPLEWNLRVRPHPPESRNRWVSRFEIHEVHGILERREFPAERLADPSSPSYNCSPHTRLKLGKREVIRDLVDEADPQIQKRLLLLATQVGEERDVVFRWFEVAVSMELTLVRIS